MAVGGAVVQVRGGERRCGGGAELGLQDQAGLEEGLRVNVLLGEPAGTEEHRLNDRSVQGLSLIRVWAALGL